MTALPETALDVVWNALETWRETADQPLILGICGAQGSGKSTLSEGLVTRLGAEGVKVALLSLDDLYLSRAKRLELSKTYHPLFATRGVPMTHDAPLGERLMENLKAGRATLLPRFDKATDQPLPGTHWTPVTGPVEVVIFEGWCIGAVAQPYEALGDAVNALEATHDPDGIWRRYVNQALERIPKSVQRFSGINARQNKNLEHDFDPIRSERALGSYARLFGYMDRLVLLAAPDFDVIKGWRTEQEHHLKRKLEREGRTGSAVMTDDEVGHFVQHYERLTRHILKEMPDRADLVVRLDDRRQLL